MSSYMELKQERILFQLIGSPKGYQDHKKEAVKVNMISAFNFQINLSFLQIAQSMYSKGKGKNPVKLY